MRGGTTGPLMEELVVLPEGTIGVKQEEVEVTIAELFEVWVEQGVAEGMQEVKKAEMEVITKKLVEVGVGQEMTEGM